MKFLSLLVPVILCIVVVYEVSRSLAHADHDERQRLIRGKAFTAAFYAVTGLDALIILLYSMGITIMSAEVLAALHLYLGVIVSAVYCAVKDAYYSPSDFKSPYRYPLVLGIIGILNLIGGIIQAKAGGIIENGMLTNRCFGLLIGLSFCFLAVVFLVRAIKIKNEPEEDEQ